MNFANKNLIKKRNFGHKGSKFTSGTNLIDANDTNNPFVYANLQEVSISYFRFRIKVIDNQ